MHGVERHIAQLRFELQHPRETLGARGPRHRSPLATDVPVPVGRGQAQGFDRRLDALLVHGPSHRAFELIHHHPGLVQDAEQIQLASLHLQLRLAAVLVQREVHIQATPTWAGRHLLGAMVDPRDPADLSRGAVRAAPNGRRLGLQPIPVPLGIQLIHTPGHVPTLHGLLDRQGQRKLPRQRLQGAQIHALGLELVGGLQAVG